MENYGGRDTPNESRTADVKRAYREYRCLLENRGGQDNSDDLANLAASLTDECDFEVILDAVINLPPERYLSDDLDSLILKAPLDPYTKHHVRCCPSCRSYAAEIINAHLLAFEQAILKDSESVQERPVFTLLRRAIDLGHTEDFDSSLQEALILAAQHCNGEAISIWLRDETNSDRIVCVAFYDRKKSEVYAGKYYTKAKVNGLYQGLTAYAYATGQIVKLDNVACDEERRRKYPLAEWKDLTGGWKNSGQKVRPLLIVPIRHADYPEEVIGVLKMGSSLDGRPFSSEAEEILEALAHHFSKLVARARRKDVEKNLLLSIFEFAMPRLFCCNKGELLWLVTQMFAHHFAGSYCSVLLMQPGNVLNLAASSAPHLQELVGTGQFTPYTRGSSKTWSAVRKREAVLFNSDGEEPLPASPRHQNQCEVLDGAISVMAAPLIGQNGKVVGVIRTARKAGFPKYTEDDRRLFHLFTDQVSFLMSLWEKKRACMPHPSENEYANYDFEAFDEDLDFDLGRLRQQNFVEIDHLGF